ncbi:MAG: excinuclease ABC subunit B, partial [Rhizobiaceae bacterium]|nr:excinuclease ABC subunit B [Rhizobiaceae bacterium]
MAKAPRKNPASAANENDRAPRRRGSPLTDYMDASEPLERKGFSEAPQRELTGAPLSGSVSDWAKQISDEAELDVERQAKPSKKKIPERSSAPTKTARGTSMGGAASPR